MHLFQVGVGSGGILVLDFLIRDPRITHFTLIDPDFYKPHNVHRHLFPPSAVGRLKVELAEEWVRSLRPDVTLNVLAIDLLDPREAARIASIASTCDVGLCAVDEEHAKHGFDALMRKYRKPWTLGEVLSGGIGGWAHRFVPNGPCYGCVASHLRREVKEEPTPPPPDYSSPTSMAETSIPASKASIAAIAALHANVTLETLDGEMSPLSLLMTLKVVPGVFESAYRTFRFSIPRSPTCLDCSMVPATESGESLDEALDHALARLGPE